MLFVDPTGLSSFVACRLIALDKNPGVHRLIAKAVHDIQAGAGSL